MAGHQAGGREIDMSKNDILSEFEQLTIQLERDQVQLLSYGPRGVSWLPTQKEVIDHDTNPLMFSCSYCRKTSSTYHVHVAHTDYEHEEGCLNLLMNMLSGSQDFNNPTILNCLLTKPDRGWLETAPVF